MKKTIFASAMLVAGMVSLNAQKKEDVKAIKDMTGCYEVSFNFAETFSPNKDYEKKKNYTSRGLEWVTVAEEAPGKIALQHILVVNPKGEGKKAIVKHWRQDWLYQNTDLYTFDKENHWKYEKLNSKDVKGQWTQVVYQVDDAPRYSGSGTWIHADGRRYWESTADAPLPRREYTTRNDYNVLVRTNKQEHFDWGWLHNQDNKKVLRQDGQKDVVIAEEKGLEYYRKVDNSRCVIAENYWKEYAPFWKAVRQTWDERMAQKKDIWVKKDVKDTYLYDPLMKLEAHQTKEAQKLVKEYIIK
ncbi:DUF6607 family protein [Bergeyella zoohelcum]|uniref:Uncharacterized protein n=1 Tax=Bergeyella zoohelcum TaxID=1015 RepID=A0A7Z8YQJ0_9FLAO|nr:DUF6607 family protein [Bergeyella zoohelcum]VDH04991.1 Uncharacterised protein [Bergeyella zoohelcum]